MRSIIFISVFFVVLSLTMVAQQSPTYTTGDKGVFAYQSKSWNNESQKEFPAFSIMHNYDGNGGMYGYVMGTITSGTEVVFLGKNLKGMNKDLLYLLDGREVTVICDLKEIGEGEQRSIQCLKLYITLVEN